MAEINDILSTGRARFYNFLKSVADGTGVAPEQRLILNSTIVPFDIATDTPFYNEELFRQYADRTFTGGVEGVTGNTLASQAERFSFQYRAVLNQAALRIDTNHPEIQNSLTELGKQLSDATSELTKKLGELDAEWEKVAKARSLTPTSPTFDDERVAWLAQSRAQDQIDRYSQNIDRINFSIDTVRRKAYTAAESAVIDNLSVMGSAFNIARPWSARTERDKATSGKPLTDVFLADFTKLSPAIYDSSPLILPIGDLNAFLKGQGTREFDTSSFSSTLDAGNSSWSASGRGSFLGWSLGGGGSGSSSYKNYRDKLTSMKFALDNISEYFIDRSAWFNPGVFQDADIAKTIANRPELKNLRFIAVSLIIVRGTTMELKFSENVNQSQFTMSSINASGGASFFGFSFGGSGGSSSDKTKVDVSADKTTVTFKDGPQVARVIGVRVEPFIKEPSKAEARVYDLAKDSVALSDAYKKLLNGTGTYLDMQKTRLNAIGLVK
jgi:cob(I)alamin adenosyltransferase